MDAAIAGGGDTWNDACGGSLSGWNYPRFFVDDDLLPGSITIEFDPGHAADVNPLCYCYPLARWIPENATIVIYGYYGEPSSLVATNLERDGAFIIAHELGHALGIDDYRGKECEQSASVMAPFRDDSGERIVTPEDCLVADAQNVTPDEAPPSEPFYVENQDICGVFVELCGGYSDPWWTGPHSRPFDCTWILVPVPDAVDTNGDGIPDQTTVRLTYIMYCESGRLEAGIAASGPTIALNAPVVGAAVRGLTRITGWTVDSNGVGELAAWLDDDLLPLIDLQRGLPSPGACQDLEKDAVCDDHAGFSALIEVSGATAGSHVLRLAAIDQTPETPLITMYSQAVVVEQCSVVAPSVLLSSPTSGSVVSGVVWVEGGASATASILGMDLLVDGSPNGTEDDGAVSIRWDSRSVSDGGHSIRLRARDGCGNVGFSQTIQVTVANSSTAPQVSVTAPVAGALLHGQVQLQAQATDDVSVARVEFYVDGNLSGTDYSAPYVYSWNTTLTPDGDRVLSAKAFDAASNFGDSAPVTVQVDNAVPRMYLDNPASGSTVSGTSVAIVGWATDRTRVVSLAFKLDGQTLPLNSPYWYGASRPDVCNLYPDDPNCPLVGWSALFNSRNYSDGSHTVEVIATDGAGLTNSIQRTLVFSNDGGVPTASITAPSGGSNVRGMVSIQSQATDDVGVTRVEFYVDGGLKGTDTSAPYAYGWDTTAIADGNHVLSAKAFDAASNFGTSPSVTMQVDNAVPRMYLDGPANNATVSGTSVAIFGWATDRTRVVSLAFKIDGQTLPLNSPYWYGASRPDVCNLYPEDPNCPLVGWSALFNSRNYSNGSHTIQVIATDGVGLTVSNQVTLNFAN